MPKMKRWTSLTLTKPQKKFLDRLSDRARFSGGAKLPRSVVIRGIVRAFRDLRFEVTGVKGEAELVKKIESAISKSTRSA